jgi:hypothetical protein
MSVTEYWWRVSNGTGDRIGRFEIIEIIDEGVDNR